MKRLRNVVLAVAATGVLVALTSPARADLPPETRTSQNAEAQRSSIDAYVKSLVEKIRGTDARSAASAREELSKQAESNPNGGVQVSASFQLVYSSAVTGAIAPMLKSEQVGERLTAAVIVYRLANGSKLLSLQQPIQTLLADDAPAVALWGVKSAGALLPSVLSGGFASSTEKLTTGIVEAVKKHPNVGPIIQDAYKALSVQNANLPPAGLEKATAAMNALVAIRVQQYINRLPADLHADRDPSNYIWSAVNPKAKSPPVPGTVVASVQNLLDLLGVSAQRFADAGGADREKLQKVAETAAGSLIIVFTNMDQPNLIAAFKPFQRLGQMNARGIATELANAVALVKKVPSLATIKDPPVVQPIVQAAAGN